MFHLLLVAFLLGAVTASPDLEAEESVPPIKVYGLEEVHSHERDGHHKHRPHDVYLHGVKGYKGQTKYDRIVSEYNNPDYFEPITVLDYRYLKTGGRDYTRGAGGQILILPKNVRTNQKKEFQNYDELLEFLRLQQLAEIKAHHREMSQLGYEHQPRGPYEHLIEINGRTQYDQPNPYAHYQYNHQHQQDLHNQHDYHSHQDYGQHRVGYVGGHKRDAAEPSPATKEEAAA